MAKLKSELEIQCPCCNAILVVDTNLGRIVSHKEPERGDKPELTEAAKELLGREGFDPIYGARPLKRAIQKELIQPLAMSLLRGEFNDGDTVLVDAADGKLTFNRREAPVAV